MPPHAYLRYAELVRAYSSRLDLVAPKDLSRFEDRHIADSLRALPYVQEAPRGPAVDVGSGAGLPGLPLAIADPERHWVLLEPRKRRAAFLEETVRILELSNVEVLVATAEELAGEGPRFSVATARALAPPEEAVEIVRPLMEPGGAILLFVGESRNASKFTELERGLCRVIA